MTAKAVRLMPHNIRRGYTVKSYVYKGQRYVGGERPVWYLVDAALASELDGLRQKPESDEAPKLFQVVAPEEQAQIEQQENSQYLMQFGLMQGAVAIPRDVQARKMEDLRPAVTMEEDTSMDGRAAALPPPRVPAVVATRTASVVNTDNESAASGGAITTQDVPPVQTRRKMSRVTSKG